MKIATVCDFGNPTRKEILRIHLSKDSAEKALKSLKKIYEKGTAKVWQEPYTKENKPPLYNGLGIS